MENEETFLIAFPVTGFVFLLLLCICCWFCTHDICCTSKNSTPDLEKGWVSNTITKRDYSDLPLDTLLCIFSALPMNYIPTLELVCKRWHNVLQDSNNLEVLHCIASERISTNRTYLLLAHPDESEYVSSGKKSMYMLQGIDNNPLKITKLSVVKTWGKQYGLMIGPCCGFYCRFFDPKLSHLYLCNPLTGERMQLPEIPRPYYRYSENYFSGVTNYPVEVYGLGIDLTNPQCCKVVRLFYHKKSFKIGQDFYECEVYTLGSKSWRHIGFIGQMPLENTIFCDGVIYWKTTGSSIIAFDLTTEKFNIIIRPLLLMHEDPKLTYLLKLDKEICFVIHYKKRTCIYKLEDRSKGKWCILHNYPRQGDVPLITLVGSWRHGHILGKCVSKICRLNPRDGLVLHIFPPTHALVIKPYFPSLLSPKIFWKD